MENHRPLPTFCRRPLSSRSHTTGGEPPTTKKKAEEVARMAATSGAASGMAVTVREAVKRKRPEADLPDSAPPPKKALEARTKDPVPPKSEKEEISQSINRMKQTELVTLLDREGVTNLEDQILYSELQEVKDNLGNPYISTIDIFISILGNIPEAERSQPTKVVREFTDFISKCEAPESTLTIYDFKRKPIAKTTAEPKRLTLSAPPSTPTATDAGVGLENLGATCFMNSSVQTLFQHLSGTDFFTIAMPNTQFPTSLHEEDSLGIPKDVYADMQTYKVPVETYSAFHLSFRNLMDALAIPGMDQTQINELMRTFQHNYQALGVGCNRCISKDIFNKDCRREKDFSKIRQEDAHECLIDILELLGISTHLDFSLAQVSATSLMRGEKTLLTIQNSVESESPILSINAPRGQAGVTLQNAVDQYLDQEEVPFTWDDEDLKVINQKQPLPAAFTSQRAIVLMCANKEPPPRLMLQVKLFDGKNKLETEGCNLLSTMDQDLFLPIYHPEGDKRLKLDTQHKRYRVNSVVCHRGTPRFGHYISISKRNSQLVCFDDSRVTVVGKLNSNGTINWGESTAFIRLVHADRFGGYIFSLEAMDENLQVSPASHP